MKPIPFFICAALAVFLNQQVNRQSYPLGFFGSGLVFTISVGYCAVYLAVKSITFLKEQKLAFLAYWLFIPFGLVLLFILTYEADNNFRHETLFSNEQYQIIGDFLPVSGGKFTYWVMEKRGIGWYRLGRIQYGRIRKHPPSLIQIDGKPALLRQSERDVNQQDTILLK